MKDMKMKIHFLSRSGIYLFFYVSLMLSAHSLFVCFCLISTCLTRAPQTPHAYWALSRRWRSARTGWISFSLTLRSRRSPRSSWRSTCHPRLRSKVAGHTAVTAAVTPAFIPQRARVRGRMSSEKSGRKNLEERYELMSQTKACKTLASNLAEMRTGSVCATISSARTSCRDKNKDSITNSLLWREGWNELISQQACGIRTNHLYDLHFNTFYQWLFILMYNTFLRSEKKKWKSHIWQKNGTICL